MLQITDHALFRYSERALGFEPEIWRRHIRNQIDKAASTLGDGHYAIDNGELYAVVKDNAVVTVITKEQRETGPVNKIRRKRRKKHRPLPADLTEAWDDDL